MFVFHFSMLLRKDASKELPQSPLPQLQAVQQKEGTSHIRVSERASLLQCQQSQDPGPPSRKPMQGIALLPLLLGLKSKMEYLQWHIPPSTSDNTAWRKILPSGRGSLHKCRCWRTKTSGQPYVAGNLEQIICHSFYKYQPQIKKDFISRGIVNVY